MDDIKDSYTVFSQVYDEFMDNVDYEGWTEFICERLKEHGITSGLVLDLGCGTGTLTELLADRGYDMIGVDGSEDMLMSAQEKKSASGHDILYLQQDLAGFELYGTVRAIVSVCDSLNYLTEEEELARTFALVSNYLEPGGVFISVTPAPDHLLELKQALYDEPYLNTVDEPPFPLADQLQISEIMKLDRDGIQDLFAMTPYFYHTSEKDRRKLDDIDSLAVTASFLIRIHRKPEKQ